jgi:hypothetical protein
MSEEHTDNLKKARARLIEQRRAFVKVLAGPYEQAVRMLPLRIVFVVFESRSAGGVPSGPSLNFQLRNVSLIVAGPDGWPILQTHSAHVRLRRLLLLKAVFQGRFPQRSVRPLVLLPL